MSKLTMTLALVLTVPMFASAVHAKGGNPQSHHCVKDGSTMPDKTRRQCAKEGGKWEKDAAAPKGAPAGDKKTDSEAK